MTGNPRAGKLLEELYARHYFTYRRNDEEVSYVYHALFREFLLDRAQGLLVSRGFGISYPTGAALLESTGEVDGAVGLYLEARILIRPPADPTRGLQAAVFGPLANARRLDAGFPARLRPKNTVAFLLWALP